MKPHILARLRTASGQVKTREPVSMRDAIDELAGRSPALAFLRHARASGATNRAPSKHSSTVNEQALDGSARAVAS